MRNFTALLALASLLCVAGAELPRKTDACALPKAATVLAHDGKAHDPSARLLQYWDVANSHVLFSTASPQTSSYRDFIRQVRSTRTLDQPSLLLRGSPTKNNQLVLASARAWIKPANCLEKLLQGIQHSRLDTFLSPTEFASFVLRSPDRATTRIYYYTVNQDGIGRLGPLLEAVERDIANGWRAVAGLHNHPFHPGNPLLNGIPAPSVPDAQLHKALAKKIGLPQAWITNGVHSARIPSRAFHRFEGAAGNEND